MKVRFWLIPAILTLAAGCMGGGQGHGNLEAHPHLQIVKNGQEAGPGPLTKENVSIGGIHIGDSQETVRKIWGEPTATQEGGGGTPFVQWYYEQHHAYIFFYRTSGTGPVGGVAQISVNSPSSLKTDKNIGIGDSLSAILEAYDHVLSRDVHGDIINVWIQGSKEEEGFFVPALRFVLKNDRITNFLLETNLVDPEIL